MEPSTPEEATPCSPEADAETKLDAEILALSTMDVPDSEQRHYHDLDDTLRHIDIIHECDTCGAMGYIGTRATPTCPRFIHRRFPLHWVKAWSRHESRWSTRALGTVGFVYQLGHGGYACPSPSSQRIMAVIANNGIHNVPFRALVPGEGKSRV
ncbi:hypothetical protein C8R47DRAFT_1210710 [Mycena vitilis]|nr:hypothetical protein C8R47DRAFT_1210710 [Mycena vitilis]